MPAAYDNYDYPSYWKGREYEHLAEVEALKSFLESINKVGNVLEIGSGYGRMAPSYINLAKKVILTEPSSTLLKIAKSNLKEKHVSFLKSEIGSLHKYIKPQSIDVVLMIRVLHHIKDPERAFRIVSKMLKPQGYFVLEYANKQHLKATILEFLRGNLTFPLEILPKDLRKRKGSKRKHVLPFKNYHPDDIKKCLDESGFKIIQKRSVSNIRSTFIKKNIDVNTLFSVEKHLQSPLSKINFGPSIFLLVQKVK